MTAGITLSDRERQLILDMLRTKLNAVTKFLFGLIVRGSTHPDSDVDLAEVYLIDLQRASTVMQIQVIQNGECLYYECATDTALLKVKWMKEYARLNEERQCILDQIKKSKTIYGI